MTSDESATTGLHEFMHLFGFSDEYLSPACEAPFFCLNSSPNVAIFKDFPPYKSDSLAREQHKKEIPWYSSIRPATLITSGTQLGTYKPNQIGLYRAHLCDNMTPNIKSWKPGSEITIMESLETTYIPQAYWPIIISALGKKSLVSKPQPRPSSETIKGAH